MEINSSIIPQIKAAFQAKLPGNPVQDQMRPHNRNIPFRMKYKVPPKQSAVLILLYPDEIGNLRFPLIRRAVYKGLHSGQMALPGGRKEKSDTSIVQAAIRETNEEVGIQKHKINVLGRLSSFFVEVSNHQVQPVVGFHEGQPSFIANEREVDEIVTAQVTDLLNDKLKGSKMITLQEGLSINAPYFFLGNREVWGATAAILNEFRHIIKDMVQ